MGQHFVRASATLALLIAACGISGTTSSASPANTCVNASAAHHAYVVVEHLSGKTLQRCVGFAGDTIGEQALMDESRVEYQTQTFSFGKAVCQVDNEPATYSQCFPLNQPTWALFIETGGAWAVATIGYTDAQLHDKEALGWRFVPSTDTSPSPPPLPANR